MTNGGHMQQSQHSRPLWIGLLACALLAPALLAGLEAMSADSIMIPPPLVFLVGVLISGTATALVALPLVLWLRKRGKLNAVYLCVGGVLIGAISFAAFTFNQSYFPQMNDRSWALRVAAQAALNALVPGSILGLVSAAALCVGAGITMRPGVRLTGAA